MEKASTICIVCLLTVFLLTPSSFGQGKYSYRFEKWLELIDYYYFQPNNLDREQIEKTRAGRDVIISVFCHAFLQQRRFEQGSYGKWNSSYNSLLFKEYETTDLKQYVEGLWYKYRSNSPEHVQMDMNARINCRREDIDNWSDLCMGHIKRALGKEFRTQGDTMPSFTEWAQQGYPALEVTVTPLPMPPEIQKFWGTADVDQPEKPEKKAVELLGIKAEPTEDLHFDGGFQKKTPDSNKKEPEMPDPSSAPDIDEFQ